MQKWEYVRLSIVYMVENRTVIRDADFGGLSVFGKGITASIKDLDNFIDEMGKEGWEMISRNSENENEVFFFKRPVEDEDN